MIARKIKPVPTYEVFKSTKVEADNLHVMSENICRLKEQLERLKNLNQELDQVIKKQFSANSN